MKAWKLALCVIGVWPLLSMAEVPAPMSTEEMAAAAISNGSSSQPAVASPTTAPAASPAVSAAPDGRTMGFAPEPRFPMGVGRGPGMGFGGYGRALFSRLGPYDPPTQSEWEEAVPFLKEHSPKRLDAINGMPD